MPTDFAALRAQISQAAQKADDSVRARRDAIAALRRVTAAGFDVGQLTAACVAAAGNPALRWNGAVFNLGEEIHRQYAFGREPNRYALLASDGSQIMPDRHKAVVYALIQVACVSFVYGDGDGGLSAPPDAAATHRDLRLLSEDELYRSDAGDLISAGELATERDLREIEVLAERCEVFARAGLQTVALADGSLVPFALLSDPRLKAGDARLARFAAALERLRECKSIVAGFITRPSSNAVVKACALAGVKYQDVSAALRTDPTPRGVMDRQLLEGWLEPWRRSAVFVPNWAINGGEFLGRFGHVMCACYANVSDGKAEIARVELPAWCADGPSLDTLTGILGRHARIGGGYPFCLKAAHEEAVITRQDQREVDFRLQFELSEKGLLAGPSPKQEAKDRG